MNYKDYKRESQARRKEREIKLIALGAVFGITLSMLIFTISNSKIPEIDNYTIVYASEGDTITSICQRSYSTEQIDKIGMNTLRSNCIEEDKDGILKIGERVLVPLYK